MATKLRYGTITIILIGTKGSGKSSTGNCILEKDKFEVFLGTKFGTNEIQKEKKENGDTDILVVDTPGVQDIEDLNENMKNLLVPENSVYAIVISIGRYTTLDKRFLNEIDKNYEHILRKSFVIFTRRNELSTFENPNDRTIDKWLKEVKSLSNFINSHQLQFRVFENVDVDAYSKAEQVKNVIKLCKEIVHGHVSIPVETNERKITVGYDEIKQAFGDKGVEFFNEKFECRSKTS